MTLSAATFTVQTLLAFDFGQKRIGVAVGNSLTGAADHGWSLCTHPGASEGMATHRAGGGAAAAPRWHLA